MAIINIYKGSLERSDIQKYIKEQRCCMRNITKPSTALKLLPTTSKNALLDIAKTVVNSKLRITLA